MDFIDGPDGYPASRIFEGGLRSTGYTYDDMIMLPGYIDFGVAMINTEPHLTKKIKLK